MAKWTPFPHPGDYQFDAASVKKHWARLHGGDAEPCPKDAAVLEAWALFHNGDFEKAAAAGLAAGGAGITAANKATSIYANYLEPKEKTRLDLFMQVAERAEAQAALLRGAHHVLNLLMPYLESGQRAHLLELVGAYAAVPG